MTQRARLITPQGKRIELTTEKYRQIKRLLSSRTRNPSRAKITRVIASTYGKYAGGASLTQALLEERAAERAREDNKLRRFNG
ncbi:MAG: hypothetical protein HY070_01450 [Chloroflexi bacterium]|nr:hypothetical protein [Chloroflexota bacterium]MBI3741047.1 hypothetical protein [Chloroflexota bacterium]